MTRPSWLALLLAVGMASSAVAQQTPEKIKVKRKRGKARTEAPVTAPAPAPAREVATDWANAFAETITQDDLRRHLTVLASDEYEGRETGEKGQKMAADYLSAEFKQLGLAGPVTGSDNPYLQHFTMERSTWEEGATLKVGSQTYKWLVDFYAFGNSPFQQATTVQPVFVGYGIEQDSYSDYAGKNVQGKDVLVLLGEPTAPDGKPLLSPDRSASKWGNDYRAKAALAAQKGARSVFFVDFDPNSNFDKLLPRLMPYIRRPSISFKDAKSGGRLPAFFVSPKVGYQLLGANAAAVTKYLAATSKAGKPVASSFKPASFTIKAPKKREDFTTENVLGFLEGTDLKQEVLVLSAHYDHIGIIDGEVHNGADDDGSGTVTVLEMAEAFVQAKANGHGPRRSILFLCVTGEEKGLLGSEYYTDHPLFPLEQTVADLNTDMVGRTDKEHEGKEDYVYVIGSDKLSSELHEIVLNSNEKYTQMNLDFRFNDPQDPNRFYYRSDHYNFAKHKVPVAFFFNGVHDDYHGPGDEVDKIEFEKMQKRARLVFHSAWELANRDTRVVVDSDKP